MNDYKEINRLFLMSFSHVMEANKYSINKLSYYLLL